MFIPVHPGERRVEIKTNKHIHIYRTPTLSQIAVFGCRCAPTFCALPPQSASSPPRRRRRPRTKWESSRFSSTIPGAPLSSSASLLRRRLLLLRSPWLCPRNPPLRSPPVISRLLLRLFTGGNGPCAPASSRLLSVCVVSLYWFPALDERPLRRLT